MLISKNKQQIKLQFIMVGYKMKNDKYKELRRALAEGKTIQLNGTAINGGYGETWNDCS